MKVTHEIRSSRVLNLGRVGGWRLKLRRSWMTAVVGVLLAAGNLSVARAQVFNDAGFTSELVVSVPAFGPVGVAWAPDGRMFIWQKNGVVRVFKNGTLLSAPFLDFSAKINTFNDNGMLGLAFDPNFASNRQLYLTYVYEGGGNPNDSRPKIARLVRVTASAANPDVVLAGSETMLMDNLPCDYGTHSLSIIRFAPDGKMFVGNGDGADPGGLDVNAWGAQVLSNVRGKIFRINPDGSAPGDNPFDDGTDSVRSKVWCYGVRNPYRFSLHPITAVPYFADVGWNDWEEIDRGIRGANYGWPCYEGTRVQSGYQVELPQCAGVTGVVSPIHEYSHSSSGTCIVGGDFYTGSQYPEGYRGNYFYADYSGGWIRRLVLATNGTLISSSSFATALGAPTCVEQGPDGLLYYLSFSSGQIRRIRYNGPSAVAAVTPRYGYSPLTVAFSSAGSTNGGGGSLAYLWEFGDGTRSSLPHPSHTYTSGGLTKFSAKLTVTNANRLTSSASVLVTVGSVPPSPAILTPTDGSGVLPGQTITYQGTASDPEDGTLPSGSLSWTVLLHHNSHVHAFTAGIGSSGSFTAENHGAIGTFSYEILLTTTDSSGLSGSTSVLLPVQADTVAPAVPEGLTALATGSSQIRLSWQPASDNAAVEAYSVERCRGAGCSDFSVVGQAAEAGYIDTSLAATNSYTYRIRAVDASGNRSGYSGTASATTLSPPPVPPGLVAAYSFNEGSGGTAGDASGHGHTGTLDGASWTTQGKFGPALSFDGGAMVSVNHSPLLGLSNGMTLEAWVNPSDSSGGWRDLIFKATDIYYLMGSSSQSGVPATGGTFSSSPLFSTGSLPLDSWSHLASTYDGTTLRLYVNGVQVASRAQTGSIRASTGALMIGGDTVFGQYWQGRIDEIRVYNRALSASQIQTDMLLPIDSSVNQPPVVEASGSPTAGPPPLAVTFSSAGSFDPEGAALTYAWTFGDGTSSSEPNPVHTYPSAGTFLARLTVSDGIASTAASSLTISVGSPAGALVAAYGFEEGSGSVVADVSGWGNWGTVSEAAWTTGGRYGKALHFDGAGALVTINDSPSLDLTTGMTLEAWVFPTAAPGGWQDIIFKETDLYYLEGSSAETGTPTMGGTFAAAPLAGPVPLPVNTWSHLAATYDGATMRLYVNGVAVASRAQSGPIRTSAAPLSIGGDAVYGQFWEGRIDEVRVYSRALSGSEVQSDMNTPVGSALNQKPVAVASAAPRSGVVPLLVTFSSAGSLDPEGMTLAYSWDFGDGTSSANPNPSHTYHTAGVFVARLNLSDGLNLVVSSNLTVTVTNPPLNSPPQISGPGNLSGPEEVAVGPVPFTVDDAQTVPADLTVTVTSSNPGLVPNGRIVLGGAGADRTVTILPATNQNGTATLTLSVSDGALSASNSFQVVITAVNDAPTLTSIADQVTSEGTPVGPVAFAVSDIETDPGILVLTGRTSNPGLIPASNIQFGGAGANRSVTVRPAASRHGTATIIVLLSDGDLEADTSFDVTVNEVPATLAILGRREDGAVLLRVSGAPDSVYTLEASEDLSGWSPLAVLNDPAGVSSFTDTEAASYGRRFYRIRKTP